MSDDGGVSPDWEYTELLEVYDCKTDFLAWLEEQNEDG